MDRYVKIIVDLPVAWSFHTNHLLQLVNLGEFTADQNMLSGAIPSTFGDLSHLALLFLQGNDLTGTLSSELGRMESVYRFYAYSNQLSGSIPTELGMKECLAV